MIEANAVRVLLVDDDLSSLTSTQRMLEFAGYEVVTAKDGQSGLEAFRSSSFSVVVSDVRMPNMGGLEFLKALTFCGDGVPVILMTAFGSVEDAVWSMKLGAVDFITKPFKRQVLLDAVLTALKRTRARSLVQPADAPASGLGRLFGNAQKWNELKLVITQVAKSQAAILIQGESGSGKELVARAVHELSSRSTQKWIALNCAALPDNLMESELFGFEKGAFTGAVAAKEGLFEAANGGTLLLDEVGDMPLTLQAKLLRVLQEGEVTRIGSTRSKKVDVRVIAASHHDLRERVKLGAFREDLLYRLEVIALRVPPLRERREDVRGLSFHFLRLFSLRHAKAIDSITEETLQILESHSWPGNVRELSNVIERAVVLCLSAEISVVDLPDHIGGGEETVTVGKNSISVQVGTSLREVEDLLIRKTLEATDGDKNMTARLLGINSRTIYRRLGEKTPS